MEARRIDNLWIGRAQVVEAFADVIKAGIDLAVRHRLSIWDAVVTASAADAGCDLLLSEDLHAGFRWRGLSVLNPFDDPMSPLPDASLDQARG